jgi:prepilin-type N-terminal cleavage/methylation domain-containing protein
MNCNHKHHSQGFTLVELMVSITITSIVVGALYSVSRSATETFNQQQRAADMQLRLRLAMERLRSDITRAGYMATPNSADDPRVCPKPSPFLQGIAITRIASSSNPVPNTTGAGVSSTDINQYITPVRMRMVGNYTTTDEFLVESVDSDTHTIRLQHHTPQWASRVTSDAEFRRIFLPQNSSRPRLLRIMSPTGTMQYVTVTTGLWQRYDSSTSPTITVASGPTVIGPGAMVGTTVGCGISGLGAGSTLAPVDMVEYEIRNGSVMAATLPELYPTGAEAEAKSDLVRSMWSLGSDPEELPGTAQLVGEYAVDFDATVVADEGMGTGAVTMHAVAWGDDTGALGIAHYAADRIGPTSAVSGIFPQRIRSVLVRLSTRDRQQDPNFGWTQRSAENPLTRFRVNADRPGAARVRTLTTEIVLPNFAARNLR